MRLYDMIKTCLWRRNHAVDGHAYVGGHSIVTNKHTLDHAIVGNALTMTN
jgi:hypothetical protein